MKSCFPPGERGIPVAMVAVIVRTDDAFYSARAKLWTSFRLIHRLDEAKAPGQE